MPAYRMSRRARGIGVVAVAAAVLALAPRRAAAAITDGSEPCARPGGTAAAVHVRVSERRLYLCLGSREEGAFSVRLARGGVGKRRSGDEKLPLGEYELGAPRTSPKYGLFVPIGYPTAEQRRRGYTGGDVGIHGPNRRVRFLGSLTNVFDTTDGCVGIATDAEMARVAAWIRKHRPRRILIDGALVEAT